MVWVVEHFQRMVSRLVKKLGLRPNDLVLDIGCNDGTLLKEFAAHDLQVVGVDPCKGTWELARKAGVTVFRTFWTLATGRSLNQLGLMPNIITTTACFYHVPDLHDFLAGVEAVCRDKGVLFMLDEVQTGLARTGEWFAFQHYGVSPDVVSMAKALGNGMPIGAIWAKSDVGAAFTSSLVRPGPPSSSPWVWKRAPIESTSSSTAW